MAPAAPPRTRGRSAWRGGTEALRLAALAALVLIAWSFVLTLPLTGPDTWPILAQGARLWNAPLDTLAERYLEGIWQGATFYRPVLVGYAGSVSSVFGEWALPFHALRLLMLLAVAWCAARLALRRGGHRQLAWSAAAVVCALHPVLVETVPVVARDADGLVALLTALALVSLCDLPQRAAPWRTALGVACALLAPGVKESGLLAPALAALLVAPWAASRERRAACWSVFGVLAVGLLAHLAARGVLFGTLGRYERVFRETGFVASIGELARGLLCPAGSVAALVIGLALLTVPIGVGLASRGPAPGGAWRRLRLVCVAWVVVAAPMMASSPRFYARYAEAILLPISVLLAGWLSGLAGSGRDRRSRLAALCGALGLIVLLSPGTPLIWEYPQWRDAGIVAEAVVAETRAAVAEADATGEDVRRQIGLYTVEARRVGGRIDVVVSPFPWRPAPRGDDWSREVETAMVLMPYSLRGALESAGWPEAEVRPGPPRNDCRAQDLEPVSDR